MELRDIALSKILVPADRSREVDEDHALAIQTEMVAGTFFDPILVRPTPRAKRPWTLVDGGHRLRAVELLGEEEITCLVIDADRDEAERIEVAANLFRHELTALDRAVAVEMYRRAWEVKHGKIKRGNPDFANSANIAQLPPSPIDVIAEEADRGFSVACAERLGLSKRSIELSHKIALGVPRELKRGLRKTVYADNQQMLLKIAGLEPAVKEAFSRWIAEGNDPQDFLREALGQAAPATTPDNQARLATSFADTFTRMKTERRRTALVDLFRAHPDDVRWALKEVGALKAPPRERLPKLSELMAEVEAGEPTPTGGGRASRPAPDHDLRRDRGQDMTRHPSQLDLFQEPLFPVRARSERIDPSRFRARLKRAMARAIRECPLDRATIAARMAQYLGIASISRAMLDAYTAESKEGHDISLVRFKAFVRATDANWLWDLVVAEEGLTLLEGDEARLAEIARLQQEQRALAAELKALRSVPVAIRRRHELG